MPWYFYVLLLIYAVVCVFLIFVILLQAGKGGGLSSLMGGGSGLGDQIGSTSVERTLNRWTTACAIAFAVIAILLAVIGSHNARKATFFGQMQAEQQANIQKAPAAAPAANTAAPQTSAGQAPLSSEAAPSAEAGIAPAMATPAAASGPAR